MLYAGAFGNYGNIIFLAFKVFWILILPGSIYHSEGFVTGIIATGSHFIALSLSLSLSLSLCSGHARPYLGPGPSHSVLGASCAQPEECLSGLDETLHC